MENGDKYIGFEDAKEVMKETEERDDRAHVAKTLISNFSEDDLKKLADAFNELREEVWKATVEKASNEPQKDMLQDIFNKVLGENLDLSLKLRLVMREREAVINIVKNFKVPEKEVSSKKSLEDEEHKSKSSILSRIQKMFNKGNKHKKEHQKRKSTDRGEANKLTYSIFNSPINASSDSVVYLKQDTPSKKKAKNRIRRTI